MVSRGWNPRLIGLSALLVFIIESYLSFFTSQVHPEPKFARALSKRSFVKLSILPHFASMRLRNYPEGNDLNGEIHCQ
jgi:hypothetical protein